MTQRSRPGHYAEIVADCVYAMSLLLEREESYSRIYCLHASPLLFWHHLPCQMPTVFRKYPVKWDLTQKQPAQAYPSWCPSSGFLSSSIKVHSERCGCLPCVQPLLTETE